MAALPSNRIERAHQMYRDGQYREALGVYTEAIGLAKTNVQKIALHSNRAACYLKLHDFKKAAEECTSVLEHDHNHSGALMLRAQTLVTLKEYYRALFDVSRLLELNPSSEVYQNLQARLKTQLSLAPILESEEEFEEEEVDKNVPTLKQDGKKEETREKDTVTFDVGRDDNFHNATPSDTFIAPASHIKIFSSQGRDQNSQPKKSSAEGVDFKVPLKESSEQQSKGWPSIPRPKGHSALDYARWDTIEDDSSEDDSDDDEEESTPQYRFCVRTVGVRPVK